jgi:hypothetical protein
MKTRADLVYKTLRNLGVLPQGQAASAEEYNQVNALVEPMIEDLAARDIITIASTAIFEDRYFLALAHVLAGHAQSDFGMQNDPALTARYLKGEVDLKDINTHSVRYLSQRTLQSDYVTGFGIVDASTLF